MAEEAHDNEGSSPAAWTTVVVILVGMAVGALAVITLDWWLGILAGAIVVAGAVAGKVMSMMGMGQQVSYTNPAAEREAEGMAEPDTPNATQ